MNTITALEQQLTTAEQQNEAIAKITDLLVNYPYRQFQVEAEADVMDFALAFVALQLQLDEANATISSLEDEAQGDNL